MRVNLFDEPAIIGMVHLQALPGSPSFNGDLLAVEEFALKDAQALVNGGVSAIMVENFGDAPFHSDTVEPITIAAMSRIISKIVEEIASPAGILVGVNVLRNDATSALSIAAACGAQFIRVNIHTGAMLTDQGVINGNAANTIRLRKNLGCNPEGDNPIAIFADVGVKHAVPTDNNWMIEQEALDCWMRGAADALIVSGNGTGQPISMEDLVKVRSALPTATILAGSGITSESLLSTLQHCDGAIVGTAIKVDLELSSPVDEESVKRLTEKLLNQP